MAPYWQLEKANSYAQLPCRIKVCPEAKSKEFKNEYHLARPAPLKKKAIAIRDGLWLTEILSKEILTKE
ncbi:MAG: hypothetical protein K9M08_12395 [Pirellula sp.]|nr:hypothetical protein [Pirellula sp.]